MQLVKELKNKEILDLENQKLKEEWRESEERLSENKRNY